MVQLGKVYKNLMVDMNPSNNKLKDRAVRILMNALSLDDRPKAENLLQAAHGQVKEAVVMGLTGASFEDALAALTHEKGFVRRAARRIKEGL